MEKYFYAQRKIRIFFDIVIIDQDMTPIEKVDCEKNFPFSKSSRMIKQTTRKCHVSLILSEKRGNVYMKNNSNRRLSKLKHGSWTK